MTSTIDSAIIDTDTIFLEIVSFIISGLGTIKFG
jgi:hypothetical protein